MNGKVYAILLSRVLVGLVKQSTTVSVSLITATADTSNRAKYIGRMTSASTIAWIIGLSTGALLYKYVGPAAPCLVACFLFCVIFVLALFLFKGARGSYFRYTNGTSTKCLCG